MFLDDVFPLLHAHMNLITSRFIPGGAREDREPKAWAVRWAPDPLFGPLPVGATDIGCFQK